MISTLILLSSGPLIWDTAQLLMQRTPEGTEDVLEWCLRQVAKLQGVQGYNNVHIWEHKNTPDHRVGTLHVQVSF